MGLNNQSTLSIKSIPKQDNNDDASMDNSSTTDAGIISGSAESAEPPDQLVQQQHPAIIVKINEKNVKLPDEDEKLIAKSDDDEYELVPPDGGYAWLVLFGAMLINILIPGGAIKSFGVLFPEFISGMNATPSQASWIPSLCYFLYSFLGPLSSILSVKYSYRFVTILGAGFCSAGMIITRWATSIEYLYISYGVMVGIGAGLSFPPTVYIVTSYFTRLRGLANGLCISGSALGSIFLPPLLRYLLDEYQYRYTCLILGAITLNCFIATIFYDPVEMHMKRVKKVKEEDYEEEEAGDGFNYDKYMRAEKILEDLQEEETITSETGKKAMFILNQDECSSPVDTPTMEHKLDIFKFPPRNGFERSASAVVMRNLAQERHRKISTPIRDEQRNNGTSNSFVGRLDSTPSLVENSSQLRLNRYQSNRLSARKTLKASPSTSSFQYISTPYHGTLSSLHPADFASHLSLKSIASSLMPSKLGDVKTNEDGTTTAPAKNKYFDISLLKDAVYLIILISNCANAISYTNFIILLPSYAEELGFDKDLGAYLLSIVSTFDLIGRIGGSALSDLNLIPKTWFFVGGLLISGISLSFLPFVTSYLEVSAICSVFGLATGTYVGITAIVMADMLGQERLTSSYGISLCVNGILQLIGPPICLTIYESIRGYRPIFFVLGIFLLVGTSLWCLMPWVQRRKQAAEDAENAAMA